MKILLTGHSDIARRRVLPALIAVGVEAIEVASLTAPDDLPFPRYRNYERAFDESKADIVYVSTANHTHAQLVIQALERGFHVVVDKPAFLNLSDMERAYSLAVSKRRLLAEATVWPYHPRIDRVKRAFLEAGSKPTRLVASFSFPPLAATDFRYREAFGGGAILDLGPYALTPGRVFFGEQPLEVVGRSLASNGEVEIEFAALSLFPGRQAMTGMFGYQTGYINRLEVLGPGVTATLDRVFSPPASLATEIVLRKGVDVHSETIAPADTFARFLEVVFTAVRSGEHEGLREQMRQDAIALDALRTACR